MAECFIAGGGGAKIVRGFATLSAEYMSVQKTLDQEPKLLIVVLTSGGSAVKIPEFSVNQDSSYFTTTLSGKTVTLTAIAPFAAGKTVTLYSVI